MNIFILDLNLMLCAQAHVDKHVVKMLTEACQLLYTAHWALAYPHLLLCNTPIRLAAAQKILSPPESLQGAPSSKMRPNEPGFRPCHIHHPCAKWVRESIANYEFCAELAIELAFEYRYRYPEKGAHESEKHAHWLLSNPPPTIPLISLTPFAIAMDDKYKKNDPVESYRNFYNTSKRERGLIQYKKRQPPSWLKVDGSIN